MTATASEAQILDMLLARAVLMATQGPTLPVASPEVSFTVPTNGKYLECTHLPNRPAWEGLSGGAVDQGIFQVTVHWPRGVGEIAPLNIAGKVRDHFARGTNLYSTGLRLNVYAKPWYSQPVPGTTDIQIPCSIPYRVYPA